MHKSVKNLNWLKILFLSSLIILCLLGLLFVYQIGFVEMIYKSDNPNAKFFKQLQAFFIGLIALSLMAKIKVTFWLKNAFLIYLGCLSLLILVLFSSLGWGTKGAQRWLNLGFISFQPTEIIKIGLIIYFSKLLTKPITPLGFLTMLSLPAILILLQPHFSFLIILTTTLLILYFLSGTKLKYIFQLSLIILILGIIFLFSADYRLKRVIALFNKQDFSQSNSYQSNQVLIALGRGGFWGQGIGNSRQKFSFLPEASSDCLFALIAEELGFLGSIMVISFYYTFFISGFLLLKKASLSMDKRLLGTGILIVIFIQVIFNLAVLVALVPFTGVPLPFISHGGTSLIISLMMVGILLSLFNHKQEKTRIYHYQRKKIKR